MGVPGDLEPTSRQGKRSFSEFGAAFVTDQPAALVEPAVLMRESAKHPGRVVEVGFLQNFEPQRFALRAEGFPVWLFALERTFCSEVVVLGFDSAASFRLYLEAHVSNPGLVN